MQCRLSLDELRLRYKSLTNAVPIEKLRRNRASNENDPFVCSMISDFLDSAPSASDLALEADLSSLTDLVGTSGSFPGSESVFDLIVNIMSNTKSESLFCHCSAFLLAVFDVYTVEFLHSRVTPAFLTMLCDFMRHSVSGMIWSTSKTIGYLAELTPEIRNAILSIFPFDDLFGRILPAGEGTERWNSALLSVVCRCCTFPLSPESAHSVASILLDFLPFQLGDRPLSLIVHTLFLLCYEETVLALLPTAFSILADHVRTFLISGKSARLVEQVLLLARPAYCHLRRLPIPCTDLAILLCSSNPTIVLRAIELASLAVLDDPASHVETLLAGSVIVKLCDHIASQTSVVKSHSAHFILLLAQWMDRQRFDILLENNAFHALLDLFDLEDPNLTMNLLVFMRDLLLNGSEELAIAQFADSDVCTRLEALADCDDEHIAAFASALLLDLIEEEDMP
jgi:hypothetical protein